jgi:hypothetical protein
MVLLLSSISFIPYFLRAWEEVYKESNCFWWAGIVVDRLEELRDGSVKEWRWRFWRGFCYWVGGNGRDGKNIGQNRDGSKMTSCKTL